MRAEIYEHRKAIVPIATQIALFIVTLIIDNLNPLTRMGAERAATQIIVFSIFVTFVVVIIGFDSYRFWFYGGIIYAVLIFIGVSFNFFPVRYALPPLSGPSFSLYFWAVMLIVFQFVILCTVRAIKWIYRWFTWY